MIRVNAISKTYRVAKKAEGMRATVRGLFRPQYEEHHAVNQVSFDIEAGEVVAFIGPNGAGKTTTLKMLSGIIHPTSGGATVAGFVPWKRERDYIGLDVLSQEAIHQFLLDLKQGRRTTIMLTSHYLADIERLCDRVIAIASGSVVYDGSLAGLQHSSTNGLEGALKGLFGNVTNTHGELKVNAQTRAIEPPVAAETGE